MTNMERSFYRHLRTGVTQQEAARLAGSRSPRSYAHDMRRNPPKRARVQRILAAMHLKDVAVLRPFIDALTATKTIVAAFNGKFLDEKQVPDWEARLKAADWLATQLRLKQAPTEAAEATAPRPVFVFQLNGTTTAVSVDVMRVAPADSSHDA